MHILLKRLAARLPQSWQLTLRALHQARQLRMGQFGTNEPEADLLPHLIKPGDWVVDVGANVGHYTIPLARLVGPAGRVIAIEPVRDSFLLLGKNIRTAKLQNVTMLNIAASDHVHVAEMTVPRLPYGLANYYRAQIRPDNGGESVLCIPLDSLKFLRHISLIKLDVEGHEEQVVRGMEQLVKASRPVLIAEKSGGTWDDTLKEWGYESSELPSSPNKVFRPI